LLDPLTDLLTHDGFRTGALFGAVAAAVVALVALMSRRVLPWAGLALAGACTVAIGDELDVEAGIVAGLVLLAAGGWIAGRRGPLVRLAAAAPGAVVLARAAAADRPDWALPAVLVVTLVGGVLVAETDGVYRRGLPPVLMAVTTFGIYVTTPDTEHSAILLGAAVPVALLGWPRPLAALGVGGSFAGVGVLAWVVVLDGVGRDGAVVGGLACLGALAVEPLARWAARPARGWAPSRRHDLVVTAAHVGLVLVCSRVAGLRSSAAPALAISAVAWLAAGVVLARETGRTPADPAVAARPPGGDASPR
jgi:hypothetical protein